MTDPWGKPLEELAVDELEALVRHHDHRYWELNAPEIGDPDYDRLVRRLQRLTPSSPLLARVGGGGEAARGRIGEKVAHRAPMLSLDKCYEEVELLAWAAGFEGPVVGSPKIDGMAIEIRYGADGNLSLAATRGDGARGDDVTANVREIPAIPRRLAEGEGGVEVRGEIYAPLSAFEAVKQDFANPRNFAAGTVKQKDGKRAHLKLLSFFAYDVQGRSFASERDKRGFLTRVGHRPAWSEELEREEMTGFTARVLARRDALDYELDGVVFKADAVVEQARLGATAHHPRYAIAYKFQGESGVSKLERVEWNVARTGTITPVAIIAPVQLSGATVTRCSLHNLNILRRLDLKLGDRVVAMRRGGVIPNVEASLGGGGEPVRVPEACPSCGRPTQERDNFLYCPSPERCTASSLKRLEHFASALDIVGIGERVVEELFGAGLVSSPADLFRLQLGDLLKLDRMGEVLAKKLLARIDARRTVPRERLLVSLGIDGVGSIVARHLVDGLRSRADLLRQLDERVTVRACASEALGEEGAVLSGKPSEVLTALHLLPGGVLSETDARTSPRESLSDRVSAMEAARKSLGVLPGIGKKKLESMVHAGSLMSVASFFDLTPDDLLEVSPARPIEELTSSISDIQKKKQRMRLFELLPLLGIQEVATDTALKIETGLMSALAKVDDLLSLISITDGVGARAPATTGLSDRKVLFTGKLATMGRKQAQAAVKAAGGETPSQVTQDLDYLVVGDEGSPLFGEGRKGSKLLAAEKLQAKGIDVKIVSEAEFFDRILTGREEPEGALTSDASKSEAPEQTSLF
jgi:DNA ligase (NAD+)